MQEQAEEFQGLVVYVNVLDLLVNSHFLELHLAHRVLVMVFSESVLSSAVATHNLLNDSVVLDEGGSEIDEFFISIVEFEHFEEVIEVVAVGYFGFLSQFATLDHIPFRENFHVHALLNVAFRIDFVAEPQQSLDGAEHVYANIVRHYVLCEFVEEADDIVRSDQRGLQEELEALSEEANCDGVVNILD